MSRPRFCKWLVYSVGLAGCQSLENALLYHPTPDRGEAPMPSMTG